MKTEHKLILSALVIEVMRDDFNRSKINEAFNKLHAKLGIEKAVVLEYVTNSVKAEAFLSFDPELVDASYENIETALRDCVYYRVNEVFLKSVISFRYA